MSVPLYSCLGAAEPLSAALPGWVSFTSFTYLFIFVTWLVEAETDLHSKAEMGRRAWALNSTWALAGLWQVALSPESWLCQL
jgi:hypothetical protein